MLIHARTAPSNKKKRRWPKRVLICAAALLTVGCLYQYLGQALDRRNHPPEGMLVDAGGFRLHMNCRGSGSPTVIAEAGGGDFSIVWRHVQRAVAEQTRFCSYDRAGFGWSESTGAVQTRERVSADLHAALINGGIDGPYIMLGHSLGGVYVRDYALRHPESIAGIVLVDSSHENQSLRVPEAMRERQASGNKLASSLLPLCSALTFTGIVRATRFWRMTTRDMSEEARVAYTVSRNRDEFCGAMRNTLVAFDDLMGQSDPPRALGDVPLIVLAHGRSTAKAPAEETWEQTWGELQKELAALSTKGEHRVINGAGHMIQIDAPDAVIDAVLDVVARTRS